MRARLGAALLVVVAMLAISCGDDDDDASEATTTTATEDATSTTTTSTTSSTTTPEAGPTIETMPHGPISRETTYQTYDNVAPEVTITPQSDGWHLGAFSCSGDLTSIRLATEAGRMYVTITADLDADEAISQLAAGPLENASVTDTTIAGWSGQAITGQLAADIDTTQLGNPINGSATNRLFPYFWVRGANFPPLDEPASNEDPETARILFKPLIPGSPAEVHVVDTPAGALSVAITTADGDLDEFRTVALATADTLTVDGAAAVASC